MKLSNCILLVIIIFWLLVHAQASEIEITDSEFTVVNASTSSPASDVLDASTAPVQLNPSNLSYIIESEFYITDIATSLPSSTVLNASSAARICSINYYPAAAHTGRRMVKNRLMTAEIPFGSNSNGKIDKASIPNFKHIIFF